MSTSQAVRKFELKYVAALALTWAVCMVLAPDAALADESSAAEVASVYSNRMSNKLGIFLGVNEPAPTLVGVNVAYNAFDFLRVSAGFGKISTSTETIDFGTGDTITEESSVTTLGLGAKAFVPGWSLTPTVGLHVAHVSYSGDGLTLDGFQDSGTHVYSTFGLDWQARSGFNASAGVAYSFKEGVGASAYVTLGWFFNWLG